MIACPQIAANPLDAAGSRVGRQASPFQRGGLLVCGPCACMRTIWYEMDRVCLSHMPPAPPPHSGWETGGPHCVTSMWVHTCANESQLL